MNKIDISKLSIVSGVKFDKEVDPTSFQPIQNICIQIPLQKVHDVSLGDMKNVVANIIEDFTKILEDLIND